MLLNFLSTLELLGLPDLVCLVELSYSFLAVEWHLKESMQPIVLARVLLNFHANLSYVVDIVRCLRI